MHKFWVGLFFISVFLMQIFINQNVSALSNAVISQIQTKSLVGGSAHEELIEIFNNSDSDIDVTNWCLKYGSAGSVNPTKTLVCINSDKPIDGLHIFLRKRSSAVFVSPAFIEKNPLFEFDKLMSSGMSDDENRWVSLIDVLDKPIILDTIEWGDNSASSTAEGGIAAAIPPVSQLLQRKAISPDILQDTDNNFNDFESSPPRTVYPYGALYELQDVCSNIIGIQEAVPIGNIIDINGDCILPPIEICPNIDGTLPPDMLIYENKCFPKPLQLNITELLPNPAGSDDGNEFIEIYNPENRGTSLSNYILTLDSGTAHSYSFPEGSYINQGEYLSFSDDDINFTLTNTDGLIVRLTYLGQTIDEVPIYNNAGDGLSWALNGGSWGYTNQPTPGLANLPSLVDSLSVAIVSTSSLKPCKVGQYRSEETGRCRNIINDVVSLVPCAEGQERNPETNRCRSITAVLASKDLKPCKAGQERNPGTNRCRNITSKIPKANYAPEQTTSENNDYTSWLIMAGIGAAAIFYCIWEWRSELIRLFRKLFKIK